MPSSRKKHLSIILLVLLLLLSAYVSLVVGVYETDFFHGLTVLFNPSADPASSNIILNLRLPRTLMSIIAGGVLSICGLALQGLFRNPLADPALIGASGGAALGAVTAIVLFNALAIGASSLGGFMAFAAKWAVTVFAFVGSLLAIFTTYRLATKGKTTDISLLLLAGIAIQAISSAGFGLMVFLVNDKQLRNITFWTLGSVSYSGWIDILLGLLMGLLPSIYLLKFGGALNTFSLGESDAFYSGIDVQRVKKWVIVLVAVAVATVTSLTGIIAFVGIIAPHLTKLLFGYDNKKTLPISILVGSITVVTADIVSRLVIPPAELPLGILTMAIGGPFFLILLMGLRKRGRL